MKRRTLYPGRIFFCILFVLAFAPAAFAVAIHAVHADLTGRTITIEGHNFVGCPVGLPPPPRVFLADEKLVITSCTEESIVAALPEGVTDGTYELKVKTGNGADIFELTIGATGLQGPPGPPGPQGPPGPAGDPATDTRAVEVPYNTPYMIVEVPYLWLSNTVYVACPDGYALFDWRGLCDTSDSDNCGGSIGGVWIPTPYCQVVWFDVASKSYLNDAYDKYSQYPTGITITMHVGVHACLGGAKGMVEAFCMKVELSE